ncbi:DUF2508 family protein [Crassaminicella profunda]|uniref:DUF2508 family protein n=1 Tax=Crassaminicella profunda TaxID=1286698 RepID=UPI001CA70536|nr:DUF2508 family protein [Crassaminicella profunda]QZY55713.1 YaaL family protein [Crassaminicella profunda]
MNKKNDITKKNVSHHHIFKTFYLKVFKVADKKTEEAQLLCDIKSALREWKNAENIFQFVTSPDLIDHAIYRIEAAKLRYIHLIKLAKKMNMKGIL